MIRRRMLRQRDQLTRVERMDLKLGDRGAFSSVPERRAAWARHRWALLYHAKPTSRPAAFWDYDGPAELRKPREWRDVTPDPEMVELYGAERAGEIRAHGELAARRRQWLAAIRGPSETGR